MKQTEELLKEVLSKQYFAVLNSVGESIVPYSNLVSFVITDNYKSLVFFTGKNTRKYNNIKGNEKVALLIDNRTNQPSDITQSTAITIIGTAQEKTGDISNLQKIFLERHPHLEQFVNDPDNVLILVKVQEYIIAGFDKTQHVSIS